MMNVAMSWWVNSYWISIISVSPRDFLHQNTPARQVIGGEFVFLDTMKVWQGSLLHSSAIVQYEDESANLTLLSGTEKKKKKSSNYCAQAN